MKNKFIFASMIIFFIGFINNISASTNTDDVQNIIEQKIYVSIDIYAIDGELSIDDYPNILENHVPEHTPALLVFSGQPSLIEIGDQDSSGNSISMTRIKFSPDKAGTKFDLDFELLAGSESNIGTAKEMDIGSVFLMSVNLNNVTKLIRVTTNLQQEYSADGQDAKQDCGEVSIFYRPPSARNLYPVTINKIDDDSSKREHYNFRLPIGKHTIYLHEFINDPDFTRRGRALNKAKSIEVDIKKNVTYHLGAKFIRKNRHKTLNGKYWEPIIWKTTERDCTL